MTFSTACRDHQRSKVGTVFHLFSHRFPLTPVRFPTCSYSILRHPVAYKEVKFTFAFLPLLPLYLKEFACWDILRSPSSDVKGLSDLQTAKILTANRSYVVSKHIVFIWNIEVFSTARPVAWLFDYSWLGRIYIHEMAEGNEEVCVKCDMSDSVLFVSACIGYIDIYIYI